MTGYVMTVVSCQYQYVAWPKFLQSEFRGMVQFCDIIFLQAVEFLYTSLKRKYGFTPLPYGEVGLGTYNEWYVMFLVSNLALAHCSSMLGMVALSHH